MKATYRLEVVAKRHKDGLTKCPDFGLGVGVLSTVEVVLDPSHPLAGPALLDAREDLLKQTVKVRITKLPPDTDQPAKDGPARRKTRTVRRSRAGKGRGSCPTK